MWRCMETSVWLSPKHKSPSWPAWIPAFTAPALGLALGDTYICGMLEGAWQMTKIRSLVISQQQMGTTRLDLYSDCGAQTFEANFPAAAKELGSRCGRHDFPRSEVSWRYGDLSFLWFQEDVGDFRSCVWCGYWFWSPKWNKIEVQENKNDFCFLELFVA